MVPGFDIGLFPLLFRISSNVATFWGCYSIPGSPSYPNPGDLLGQPAGAFHGGGFNPQVSSMGFNHPKCFYRTVDSSRTSIDCTSLASISSGAFMAHIVEIAFQCCDSLGGISMGEFVTTDFSRLRSFVGISLGANALTGEGAFVAPLWRALVWKHLWRILGRVLYNTAILWRAFV